MEVQQDDKFWFEDPWILIKENRLVEFIPLSDHTIEEGLNSIVRFSFYIAILLFVFKRHKTTLFLPIFALTVTFFIYYINKDYKNPNDELHFPCQRPSETNPLMNTLVTDYMDRPNKKSACDVFHVKKDIAKYLNKNSYKNAFDVLTDDFRERPFYTMPNTTIPNKQHDFADWLYKEKDTCKTNIRNCYVSRDIRQDRDFNDSV